MIRSKHGPGKFALPALAVPPLPAALPPAQGDRAGMIALITAERIQQQERLDAFTADVKAYSEAFKKTLGFCDQGWTEFLGAMSRPGVYNEKTLEAAKAAAEDDLSLYTDEALGMVRQRQFDAFTKQWAGIRRMVLRYHTYIYDSVRDEAFEKYGLGPVEAKTAVSITASIFWLMPGEIDAGAVKEQARQAIADALAKLYPVTKDDVSVTADAEQRVT